MATTYLTRTVSSTGSKQKATLSEWVKRSGLGINNFYGFYEGSSSNFRFRFDGNDKIDIENYKSSSTVLRFVTNRVFRDVGAFYNIVVEIDTTQATETNRFKLYINGVQETSFSTATYPSQNLNLTMNEDGHTQQVGSMNGTNPFNGSMSHVNYSDGYAYDASTFGSTDSTTGEWKINTSPSFTLGTNGFTILKDGNTITDQSSNSNNFSLAAGAITKTEDCPDNVFSTLNALDRWLPATGTLSAVLSSGNTQFNTGTNSVKAVARSSIGVSSGKWYCEIKALEVYRLWLGIVNRRFYTSATNNFWTTNLESGFFWNGNSSVIYTANDVSVSNYGGYANNDILMMALDMDNKAWYLGKNGSWLNSGNPESGSSKTGSVTGLTNFGTNPLTNYGEVFFMAGDSSTAGTANAQWNFGNGHFGTTGISSAGTNASGNGIFEYNVPTGYTALSTKGLNL